MSPGYLSHGAWRKATAHPLPTVKRLTDDILNGITLSDPKCDCCSPDENKCKHVPMEQPDLTTHE